MDKRRPDPRVRFQHADFTRKLHAARTYKRSARARPESRLEANLQKVGLASLATQLFLASILIVAVYLLYVPNFLFLKQLNIEGLDAEYQEAARQAIKTYESEQPWYVSPENFLFLNTNKLAQALDNKVPGISRVESVEKSFRHRSVTVKVVQKYERFMVVRPDAQLLLFNDGVIKSRTDIPEGQAPALPLSGALVTISTNDNSAVEFDAQYLGEELRDFVERTATLFPEKTGQNFAYFEVKLPAKEDGGTPALANGWKKAALTAVLTKKPELGKSNPPQLKVILEPGEDLLAAADRLKLLLDQTQPERYRQLEYVDLRLLNRAYLCLINAPCAESE